MHDKIEQLKPVLEYVHERRGRFAILGTAAVLLPFTGRRVHDKWDEFEKDFHMYDQMHKKQTQKTK